MTIQELREFKQKLLDKYVGSEKDKDLRKMMRCLDGIIAQKLKVKKED